MSRDEKSPPSANPRNLDSRDACLPASCSRAAGERQPRATERRRAEGRDRRQCAPTNQRGRRCVPCPLRVARCLIGRLVLLGWHSMTKSRFSAPPTTSPTLRDAAVASLRTTRAVFAQTFRAPILSHRTHHTLSTYSHTDGFPSFTTFQLRTSGSEIESHSVSSVVSHTLPYFYIPTSASYTVESKSRFK